MATGPAFSRTPVHERKLCGLPEAFGEELPTEEEDAPQEARGSADPEPRKRRDGGNIQAKELGGQPPTAAEEAKEAKEAKDENQEVMCPRCQSRQSALLHLCMHCMNPLSQIWKGEIEDALQQLMDALVVRRRWTDRGPRSAAGDERRRLAKYARRGFKLKFGTCSERFKQDARWRYEMMRQGWDYGTIGIIDEVAAAGTPYAHDSGRRTKEQREKSGKYYHGLQQGTRNVQVPSGILERPIDVKVTNARRREATEYWRAWAGWQEPAGDEQRSQQEPTREEPETTEYEWHGQSWWNSRRWSSAWRDYEWR